MIVTAIRACALCLLVLALPVAAPAMDADELIAKNIEARGGLDRIQSVASMSIEGTILTQGMEFPFTMTQKRPDKLKIEASVMGMTMTQCFADGGGWAINPMLGSTEPQSMSVVEAKGFSLQADLDGPLVDYGKKGYTVKYVGEEDVEGTPVHRLSLDSQDGIAMDFFLDKENHLAIMQDTRMTVEGNEMTTRSYMSDFQDVDGRVMPFSVETRMGDTVLSRIVYKSVKLNQEIDDSVFAKPAAPSAPAVPVQE